MGVKHFITGDETMTNLPFVYVMFRSPRNKRKYGELKRFESAIPNGYPDILTYLKATSQIDGWCELATDEEAAMYDKAETCRLECLRRAANLAKQQPWNILLQL